MDPISSTDLILNKDGSIFHLHLLPEDIAETVILVGDPGRVELVSSRFDQIEVKKQNREFLTHTGVFKGKRLSVVSSGIGTDNIDIVLNEIDALVNIDLKTRTPLTEKTSLRFIRLGTSGGLQAFLSPGAVVMSCIAGGLDSLLHFYSPNNETEIQGLSGQFCKHTQWPPQLSPPYFVAASTTLLERLKGDEIYEGITLSTPGFYAPQFRTLRLPPFDSSMMNRILSFDYKGFRVLNFEMESSAIYALSSMMGHEAITLCAAIGNRIKTDFMVDYHRAIENMIDYVLEKLAVDERK